ncbi:MULTISPECIES: hypothetical protein [Streptosporangium]|uniref:DUF4178 domain-containing protein n=1 Tax=Streptosporangium jomthongense TaxID=1193683 RepID=A0ABV8EYI7_9ACTN
MSSIGAPGFPLIGSLAVVALLLLYGASYPGGVSLWVLPVLLVALVLGVIWFGRLVARLLNPVTRPDVRRNLPRWAAPPAIGLLVLALVMAGEPAKSRFALSEQAFERVARSAVAGDADWKTRSGTLGSFDISWAERHGNTVRFALAGGGDVIHAHGLIWSPYGEPPLPEEEEYEPHVEHYYGPWYLWVESF